MNDFYGRKIQEKISSGIRFDCWTKIDLQAEDAGGGRYWYIIKRGSGIQRSDVGFWLNGAHKVEVLGGSFEAKKISDNEYLIRNTHGRFRWYDEIDSNPNWNDGPFQWFVETVNQAAEAITGASFFVEIDWSDGRDEEITINPSNQPGSSSGGRGR